MNIRTTIALFTIGISIIGIFGYWWNTTAKDTGLCIYKGPFINGGLFGPTSNGVELRDIHVLVFRNSSYTSSIAVIVEGNTDRTGCFIFYEHEGYIDYATYTYNGIRYTDTLVVGLILRDNLP